VIKLFFINNVYELLSKFALFIHHFFTFVTFLLFYVFVHQSLHFNFASFRCCEGIYKLVACNEQNMQTLVYDEQNFHFAKI
jgi:hypothetical protein